MNRRFYDLGFSEIGRYEKRTLLLVLFIVIFCVFPPLQSLVTQYTPPHHCNIDDLLHQKENISIEPLTGLVLNWTIPWERNDLVGEYRSSCRRYNVSNLQTNLTLEELYANRSKPAVIPCDSFTFEAVETSAVTEFEMVCEKSWQQPLFISLLMCGMAVGGMLSGTFSDRFGRKPTLLCSVFLRFSCTLITSFSSSVTMYGVMVFLTGTTALIDYISAFVLVNELSPSRFRPFVNFTLEFTYSIGSIILGLMAYLLPDWRWFLRVIGFLGILYIPYFWWIDESVSWLVASGKLEEAEKVLNKIAKVNKQPAKSVEDVKQSLVSHKDSASFKKVFKELLNEPALVRRLFIMVYSWFIICMAYYAIIYSSNNFSGDRYLNIVLQGLTGVAAITLYLIMAPLFGHRKLYILMTFIVSIILAFIPFLQVWYPPLATALAFVAKTSSAISFVVVYGMAAELFPTISRQLAFGICNCAARFGGIVAPFVLTVGNSGSSYVTGLTTALCAFLSVIMFGFLPETKHKKLPHTEEEALALKSGWSCCSSCKKTKLSSGRPHEVEEYKENSDHMQL